MHDLIGDIHDHADALVRLLAMLGYAQQHGIYRYPDRQAIFLGDFIHRGPILPESLEIVRPMIDSGAALSVMGNHELNALAYHTPHRENPASSSGYAPPRIPTSTPRRCGGCRPANWLCFSTGFARCRSGSISMAYVSCMSAATTHAWPRSAGD